MRSRSSRNGQAVPSAPATAPAAPAAPAPASSVLRTIDSHAVGTLSEWQAILNLPQHTLRREARLGRLRTSRRAGKLWATGAWVREWIESGEVCRGRACQQAPTDVGNKGLSEKYGEKVPRAR